MISLRYLAETHTKPLWEHVHNLGRLGFPQKTPSPMKMNLQLNVSNGDLESTQEKQQTQDIKQNNGVGSSRGGSLH